MSITAEVAKLREISDSVTETIDSSQPIQVPQGLSVGDAIPQGDIRLRVIESLPEGAQPIPFPQNGQIAPGDTKGSRHRIPGKYQGVLEFYRVDDGDPLSDLCIKARGSFDLCHPEHADHLGYPGDTIYRVDHQMNAQRMRVID